MLPVDSLAHPEVADSNSVWEAPAQASRHQAAAWQLQASLKRAQETLRDAPPRVRLRAASRQQEELAVAPQEPADAQAAWQQPGLAQEKLLLPPQAERLPALEELKAELAPRVSLRRRSPGEQQPGLAREQLEQQAAGQRVAEEEEEEERRQRASCALL